FFPALLGALGEEQGGATFTGALNLKKQVATAKKTAQESSRDIEIGLVLRRAQIDDQRIELLVSVELRQSFVEGIDVFADKFTRAHVGRMASQRLRVEIKW